MYPFHSAFLSSAELTANVPQLCRSCELRYFIFSAKVQITCENKLSGLYFFRNFAKLLLTVGLSSDFYFLALNQFTKFFRVFLLVKQQRGVSHFQLPPNFFKPKLSSFRFRPDLVNATFKFPTFAFLLLPFFLSVTFKFCFCRIFLKARLSSFSFRRDLENATLSF